jgi:dipeptide/tripeptide permease
MALSSTGFRNLQRMAIGLGLSVFGMAAAVLCERKRLSVAKAAGGGATLPISVFFLIPQFVLVGSGEAFIYTGQLDFFITGSPKGMKTMSTGLFLTTLKQNNSRGGEKNSTCYSFLRLKKKKKSWWLSSFSLN